MKVFTTLSGKADSKYRVQLLKGNKEQPNQ